MRRITTVSVADIINEGGRAHHVGYGLFIEAIKNVKRIDELV